MNLELNQDGLCLKPKQMLKVRNGAGHAILCHSGSLWLTQYGDGRDIVLGAGESFRFDRDGLALVQALEQSSVSLTARAARPRRAAARSLHAGVGAQAARTAIGV